MFVKCFENSSKFDVFKVFYQIIFQVAQFLCKFCSSPVFFRQSNLIGSKTCENYKHKICMRKFLLYYFQVAQLYDPSFVELQTSRGTENYEHKIFMRNSVLIVDVLLYVRAHHIFSRILSILNFNWYFENKKLIFARVGN